MSYLEFDAMKCINAAHGMEFNKWWLGLVAWGWGAGTGERLEKKGPVARRFV